MGAEAARVTGRSPGIEGECGVFGTIPDWRRKLRFGEFYCNASLGGSRGPIRRNLRMFACVTDPVGGEGGRRERGDREP